MTAVAAAGAAVSPAPVRRRGSARIFSLVALLTRPSRAGRAALVLPITAFAVTTALLLTVWGGTMMFLRAESDGVVPAENAAVYAILAVLAFALLFVPLTSLAGAAARLSARRRDDRLATLRLLGATSREVRTITVVEASMLAVAGSLAGVVLHVALLPAVGLIPFFGAPIGWDAAWAGWPAILVTPFATAMLAAVSSMIGLRRVVLTPLGVRNRSDAPRVRWIGVLIGVAVIAAGYIVLGSLSAFGQVFGAAIMIGVLAAVLAGGLGVVNLIGPPLVRAFARRRVRRGRTAVDLIAGRQLIADARIAWRRVSGIAVVSFVAVLGGVGTALAGVLGDSDPTTAMLSADMRTGVLLTLGIAFVLLACSLAITNAASIYDDADLVRGLDRLGVPVATMDRVRRVTAFAPLRVACGIGVVTGVVLAFPLVGLTLIISPEALATIALTFAAGFVIVLLGIVATRPIVRSVLRDGVREV